MPPVEKPNYTQIPNSVLDGLAQMKEAEARVVLALCRRTFGWHKRSDRVSLTQLQEMTGMSRQGVIQGIEAALAHKWVKRVQHGQNFTYTVLVNEVDQSTKLTSQQSRPVLVNKVDQLPKKLVNEVDTQKKELLKEKERKQRGGSEPKTQAPAPTHPAICAYEEVFERKPNKQQAQAIAESVTDTAHWRTVITDWARKGYSPANVVGQLDVYAHGWRESARHAPSNGYKPADDPTFGGFVVPIIPLEETP